MRKAGFRSSFEHGVWLINSQERCIGNAKIVIKSKTFNFQKQEEMMNVMKYNIGKKDTTHPTEKPLILTENFINIFTNKGDIVLDPFLGSGTTAVACKNLDRNYIGIELNQEYVKIAEQRIKEIPQKLF
jgi:site-specific DNA-methyltransferase (adenine-specific)